MPKNFVGEPFCAVFPKISRSEKVYGEEGRGEIQDLPPEILCLTMPKNLVWELLCAVFQNFPGSGKDFE